MIFGAEVIPFSFSPETVNRYLLAPLNPVLTHYTVNPSMPPPERPAVQDTKLKLEGAVLTSKNASRDAQCFSGYLARIDEA
jgi:SWI/SNF-related matrix-associated actin-dependent regulator of chromatin subfamily D